MDRMVERLSKWRNRREARYVYMWAALVSLIIVQPFISQGVAGAILLSAVLSMFILSSVYVSGRKRIDLIIGTLLVISFLIFRWTYLALGFEVLNLTANIFSVLALSYTTILLFLSLMRTKKVTSETMWQAVSVYMLLGIAWTSMFSLLETIQPGSLYDSINPNAAITYGTMIYYSFVTLATLGYGDILPVTPIARSLAILEVLTGVLYLAILISRLVGTWKPGED